MNRVVQQLSNVQDGTQQMSHVMGRHTTAVPWYVTHRQRPGKSDRGGKQRSEERTVRASRTQHHDKCPGQGELWISEELAAARTLLAHKSWSTI